MTYTEATDRTESTRRPRPPGHKPSAPSLRDLLHRASQRADDDFMGRTSRGLTSRQLCLMAALVGNEGVSQTGLVEITGVDRSTLADIVKRLQRKGYLQRRRTKEDARAYAVKLSDLGKRELRGLAALSAQSDAEMLGALSAFEQKTFLKLLERVALGSK